MAGKEIVELFRANNWVVTTEQLLAAGMSTERIASLERRGVLASPRRGVYVPVAIAASITKEEEGAEALRARAVLARSRSELVVSHQSAAVMHGLNLLSLPTDRPVTVTQPRRGEGSRSGHPGVHIRTADLPREHVTRMYGVPCTTVARTVIDLARGEKFLAGVVAADNALHHKKTSPAQLQAVLERCAGWPQVARARRVVEFSDRRAESVLESIGRVVMHEHGLEPPDLQVELGGADGFIGRVDYYWPQYWTVAEADGKKKYDTRDQAINQLRRDARLREAGFEVVHFTWAQIMYTPEKVIAAILAAFARAERLR